MSWKPSNSQEQRRLEQKFSSLGIPFDTPGFYDHPAFLEAEHKDPRFLEMYARYVEARMYSGSYIANAAPKITAAATALEAAVAADGRLGACVDASGMLGRMLDRLGVWNYVAKSTLTITFPRASALHPRYFWAVDAGDFIAPHAIVVAPPFGVVDVTVRHQHYDAGQAAHIPSPILANEWGSAKWTPEDLANTEVLTWLHAKRIPFLTFLRNNYLSMTEVMQVLPVRNIKINETTLKYVTIAVGMTNEPLEEITGYKPKGRTALQIFEQDIQPQFP
ncbi:hypothetical protein V8G57_13810 [Collimonas sp. H4R21]|uniref:Uncharacterized protein n=1 Tax=Collimonas rhizosphaerae TaxID=3126357 RepID=A0ABU9PWS3_9BURK